MEIGIVLGHKPGRRGDDIAGAPKLGSVYHSATLIEGFDWQATADTSIGALCPITSMDPVLAITGMVARAHVLRPRWGELTPNRRTLQSVVRRVHSLVMATSASEKPDSMEAGMDLRYPIGQYRPPSTIGDAERRAWIAELESLPDNLRSAVDGLNDRQLETPYRSGGWTVRHLTPYSRWSP